MQKTSRMKLTLLIIAIMVLLILVFVVIYSGLHIIESSKLAAFTADLKKMQTQVNTIYEQNNKKEIGEEIKGNVQTQADKVFTELKQDTEAGITSQDGYRYWSQDLIKELGIKDIEQDFFVNLEKRSVVSYQGFKYEGKIYYTLSQVPNGLYNVGYENPNQGKPTFQISQEKLSEDNWKITISDIQYEEGYIDKWQVQYQLEGKENWNTTNELSFTVNTSGRYHVVLRKEEIQSDLQIISIGSSWEKDKRVNAPNLMEGMTAIYWDAFYNEKTLTSTNTEEQWNKWYEYVAGNNTTDTKTSKWANAKTSDGSYWVWIPRYEYRILSGEGTNEAGKIEVKFIPTTQTKADEGYKIHPAFTNGTSNHFKNGEWDSELPGIWVAKYESSRSDATTSSAGSSNTLKVVPGVQSWRGIKIGDSYTTAYNYNRNLESHLMKNSEWGAVAYLTHSQYGRNGNEIDINNSNMYITGNGEESTNVSGASNNAKGEQASSTGNIYGIYDLSGGAWEQVATYIPNGDESLSNGSSFVEATEAEAEGYQIRSTKYVTVYPSDFFSDSANDNYLTYKNTNYGYGDAILETSANGDSTDYGWFDDISEFAYRENPFLLRGGDNSNSSGSGIFSFCYLSGIGYNNDSFRVVLAGT